MDKLNKTDIIAGGGGFIVGGICGIDLLRAGASADWFVIILQFLGVLLSAFMTSMVMIVGKYFGESIVDSMKQFFKTRKIRRDERRQRKKAA